MRKKQEEIDKMKGQEEMDNMKGHEVKDRKKRTGGSRHEEKTLG